MASAPSSKSPRPSRQGLLRRRAHPIGFRSCSACLLSWGSVDMELHTSWSGLVEATRGVERARSSGPWCPRPSRRVAAEMRACEAAHCPHAQLPRNIQRLSLRMLERTAYEQLVLGVRLREPLPLHESVSSPRESSLAGSRHKWNGLQESDLVLESPWLRRRSRPRDCSNACARCNTRRGNARRAREVNSPAPDGLLEV